MGAKYETRTAKLARTLECEAELEVGGEHVSPPPSVTESVQKSMKGLGMRGHQRVELVRLCVVASCKIPGVEEGGPPPVFL